MTDTALQNGVRYYVGATSVLRRCWARVALGACLLILMPLVGASANPYNAIWGAFQQRCLMPFERFAAPIVEDLVSVAGREGAYQLDNGAVLVVSGSDAMGSRSCAVEGAGLIKGYREWSALTLQTGTYRESDVPGLWMSFEWIEPRIAVEKTPGAIRVVETFLES